MIDVTKPEAQLRRLAVRPTNPGSIADRLCPSTSIAPIDGLSEAPAHRGFSVGKSRFPVRLNAFRPEKEKVRNEPTESCLNSHLSVCFQASEGQTNKCETNPFTPLKGKNTKRTQARASFVCFRIPDALESPSRSSKTEILSSLTEVGHV